MTLGLIEAAVNALYAYLYANMSAKVTIINARYGDAYTLENIKNWYVGNFPAATPEQPSVVLMGSGWTPRVKKDSDLYGDSQVSIVVLYGADDPEKRFRVLSRYAIAIIELMIAGQSSMGYSFKFNGPVAISDTLRTPMFLQGVTIPIALEKLESV